MYGLSMLELIHVLTSVNAVVIGLYCFINFGRIDTSHFSGVWYVGLTALGALSRLADFASGGVSIPRALTLLTLLAITVAAMAHTRHVFGWRSLTIETVCYSMTFLFHMLPGVTETLTRFPYGHPLLASTDELELQRLTTAILLLFVAGSWHQIRHLRFREAEQLRELDG
jgi:hypothetical protein